MAAPATAKAETAIAAASQQDILTTIMHQQNDRISSREVIFRQSPLMSTSLGHLRLLL